MYCSEEGNPNVTEVNGFGRIVAVIALVAVSAFPAGVSAGLFPLTSGDISSAADWGGTLPGSDAHLAFNSGTYTMTNDCTFGSVTLKGQHTVFDFTDGNHTLSLTQETNGYGGVESVFQYPCDIDYSTTILKGGTWYSPTAEKFWVVGLGKDDYTSYTFVLTNSCVLTNISFVGARRTRNMHMLVTDSSKIHCAGSMWFWDVSGTNSLLEITGGGNVTVNSALLSDYHQRDASWVYDSKSRIDVHGEDSSFVVNGDVKWGHYAGGFGIRVSDAAVFTATSRVSSVTNEFHFAEYAGSVDNWVEILDHATCAVDRVIMCHSRSRLTVSNAVFSCPYGIFVGKANYDSGYDPMHSSNRVEFLDGAKVSVPSIYFRCGGNTMIVSNSVLNINGGTCYLGGSKYATNNTFILSGKNASFGYSKRMFSAGTGNRFRIENGAEWSPVFTSDLKMFNSSNNTLQVTSGAKFKAGTTEGGAKVFNFSASANVSNNVLEVSDGAEVLLDKFYLSGNSSCLVISNATVSSGPNTEKDTISLWMGQGTGSYNTKLLLRGNTPAFRSRFGCVLMLQKNPLIRYEIPADGYPEGHVAVTAGRISLNDANSRLEIECSDWAEGAGIDADELVLMRLNSDFTTSLKEWVYKQDLNLPENVTILVRGTDLILRRKSPGLIFTVR